MGTRVRTSDDPAHEFQSQGEFIDWTANLQPGKRESSFGKMSWTAVAAVISNCGMYIPLSDDKHRFVQKVNPIHADSHWER